TLAHRQLCLRRSGDGAPRHGQEHARGPTPAPLRGVRARASRLQVRPASGQTVSVLESNTFVVSAPNCDVDSSPAERHGPFHRATRSLSRLVLPVDGKPLQALSTDDLEYYDAQFFLVPGTGSAYTDATLSIVRHRVVGAGGFSEELTVMNHAADPL